MQKLLVIADDLSGATDVGVQFSKQGVRAFVAISNPGGRANLARLFQSQEVVLIDIESRHVPPNEARRRVRAIVEEARSVGVEFFYKKTDSTLRGNVGAEVEALLQATGQSGLCFIPAHPALGRTTRDGIHFVHGKPLHESAFSSDPRNPIIESRVAALLARQTQLPVTLIRPSELGRFVAHPPEGIVVFDAETESELERAAQAIRKAGCLIALAGPAAFAALLPSLIPISRSTLDSPTPPRQFLVVNGSLNEVALRQCAVALKHRFARVAFTPEALLADGGKGESARKAVAAEARALLRSGRDVLLNSVQHRADCEAFDRAAAKFPLSNSSRAEQVAFNTGRVVRSILAGDEQVHVGFGLVVFGGDTLAGIARANGWSGFVPRHEPLPGVALSEVPETGLIVFSKPGGFGEDDVLLKVHDFLNR